MTSVEYHKTSHDIFLPQVATKLKIVARQGTKEKLLDEKDS